MINKKDLDPDLLNTIQDAFEPTSEYNATLNARGLYHSMQFVLRLSPKVHELVDKYAEGNREYSRDELPFEAIEAFSTYIHETIHWWQHIGSTSGFVMSLSYPGQVHTSLDQLREVLASVGPKKSLKEWAERAALSSTPGLDDIIGKANVAVNNALDVEFYKHVAIDPSSQQKLFEDRYFESAGHSYHIAYGHALSLISSTCDPTFAHLPNAQEWQDNFRRLNEQRVTGYYHGSPMHRTPVGLHGLFEGQARFGQLQYLCFGTEVSCQDLRDLGYFKGIYVEAFDAFLEITQSSWPDRIDDPIVGLFLLICDVAINPTRGFPLQIENYDGFLFDVDPGIRFVRLCVAARNNSTLKLAVKSYSRDEYEETARLLTEAAGLDHPFLGLATTVRWASEAVGFEKLMQEYATFDFDPTNLPIRVLLAHHVAFCQDKFRNPEFFCWPGAWMTGDRVSQETRRLWLTHLSLFSDRADNDGIFARKIANKPPENIMRTYNRFYQNTIIYDLTRQWIINPGPFVFNYKWLTTEHSGEDLAKAAKDMFQKFFGVSPDDFEILD